jgi:hypothetical protein
MSHQRLYKSKLTEDSLVLYDDQIYKAFLGQVQEKSFVSSTNAEFLPPDNTGAYFRFELEASNNFQIYTRIDYGIL